MGRRTGTAVPGLGPGPVALVLLGLLLLAPLARAHHREGDHNCADFATWQEAQAFYLAEGGPQADPHGLDADRDGIACEGLANAPQNPATATARALLTTTPVATATPSRTATPQPTPSPAASATRPPTATPTVPATLIPPPALCLAYVYSADLVAATGYRSLLQSAGIRLDLIHQSHVQVTDFGPYSAVLIGPDTGNERLWGDPATEQANHITSSHRPMVLLGWGGSSFAEVIDLDKGWGQGVVGTASSLVIADAGSPILHQPVPIAVPADGVVALYQAPTGSIAIESADGAPHLNRVGRSVTSLTHYPLIGHSGKHWLWGFNDGPANMTLVGQQLLLNLVRNLPGAACTAPTLGPTPLVTSTATAAGSPTAMVSATPTMTATSTLVPTPTSSPTLAPVGGRGLGLLSTEAQLTWEGGVLQTGYALVRWTPPDTVVVIQPGGAPLPANATSYVDSTAAGDAGCYLLLPLGGAPPGLDHVLGLSDLLCRIVTGSGTAPVAPFILRLHESSIATLTLQAGASRPGDRLVALTFDGAEPMVLPLPPGTHTLTHDTKGRTTCFQLQAASGSVIVAATNLVCGVPGIATLGTD